MLSLDCAFPLCWLDLLSYILDLLWRVYPSVISFDLFVLSPPALHCSNLSLFHLIFLLPLSPQLAVISHYLLFLACCFMLLLFSVCHLPTLCIRNEELCLNNKTVPACIGCWCFFLHGNIHVICREIIKKQKARKLLLQRLFWKQ